MTFPRKKMRRCSNIQGGAILSGGGGGGRRLHKAGEGEGETRGIGKERKRGEGARQQSRRPIHSSGGTLSLVCLTESAFRSNWGIAVVIGWPPKVFGKKDRSKKTRMEKEKMPIRKKGRKERKNANVSVSEKVGVSGLSLLSVEMRTIRGGPRANGGKTKKGKKNKKKKIGDQHARSLCFLFPRRSASLGSPNISVAISGLIQSRGEGRNRPNVVSYSWSARAPRRAQRQGFSDYVLKSHARFWLGKCAAGT